MYMAIEASRLSQRVDRVESMAEPFGEQNPAYRVLKGGAGNASPSHLDVIFGF